MRNVLMALAAASFLAGCGGGGSGGGGGSTVVVHCTFTGDTCDAITGVMTAAQRTALETSCTGSGGVVGVGACPTAGMLAGHCSYGSAAIAVYTGITLNGATMVEYYDPASWTAVSAQSFCEAPPAGTWSP